MHEAIGAGRRVAIAYQGPEGAATERTIRPLGLYFWGRTWTVAAWCELRSGFRSFRLDRIAGARSGDPFPADPALSLDAFLVRVRAEARTGGETPRP